MWFKRIYPLVFLSFVFAIQIFGQEQKQERPKIGLVLSGGGAKGFAHVGALKVIEESGIPIDFIGGTSMGSVIGALYALGYSPEDMAAMIRQQVWPDLINDRVSRVYVPFDEKDNLEKFIATLPIEGKKIKLKTGLVNAQMIELLLEEMMSPAHGVRDFHELPTPFLCIATDIVSGEAVILNSGHLPEAVRASMSIPSFFTPVEIDGRLLVDGGVINNYPVKEVKDMGADIIIGVDVQEGLYARDELNSMVRILDQTTAFYRAKANELGKSLTDYYIHPDLQGYDMMSFTSFDSIMLRGERAARQMLPELKALADSLNDIQFKIPQQPHTQALDSVLLMDIKFTGLEKTSIDHLKGLFNFELGKWVAMDDLMHSVNMAYGSNFFEKVNFQLADFHGGTQVIVKVKEASIGSLGAAVHYDTDYGVSLLLNGTFRNLGMKSSKIIADLAIGDNSRIKVGYILDRGLSPGFGADLDAFGITFSDYENGRSLNEFTFSQYSSSLYAMLNFRNSYQFRAGGTFEYTSIDSKFDTSEIVSQFEGFNSYLNLFAELRIDTYNKKNFPTSGIKSQLKAKYISPLAENWSRDIFDNSLILTFSYAQNLAFKHNWVYRPQILLGATLRKAIAPFQHWFFIGGQNQSNYLEGFIPFVGMRFVELDGFHHVLIKNALQWNFWKQNYFTAKFDFGNVTVQMEDLFSTRNVLVGYGLSYGLESFIGPIEFTVMGSSEVPGLILYVTLGYWF